MEPTGPPLEESLARLRSPVDPASHGSQFPSPPPVHWFGLVLAAGAVNLLGEWLSHRTGLPLLKELLSSEVFLYLWLCAQAAFVQRLDPRSRVLMTTLAGGGLILAGYGAIAVVDYLIGIRRYSAKPDAIYVLAVMLMLAGPLVLLVDLFRMRHTLEAHYNRVEPYGLSMSGLLLLIFGPFYLQYHLLKIAQWKMRQPGTQQADPRR